MQKRKTVLITGANRGIGLGLTTKFLSSGYQVLAAARNPAGARELWELEHSYPKDRLKIVELDVTSDSDLHRLAGELKGQPIDVLINNAGFLADPAAGFIDLSTDAVLKSFTINTLGPIRLTQSLLENLRSAEHGVVVTISSQMGSLKDNSSGGYYGYRMSKAAVNMFVRSFAADHPELIAVTLHPGWVKTDMGGQAAPTTVEESAQGLITVIKGLRRQDSGRFIDFHGRDVPW